MPSEDHRGIQTHPTSSPRKRGDDHAPRTIPRDNPIPVRDSDEKPSGGEEDQKALGQSMVLTPPTRNAGCSHAPSNDNGSHSKKGHAYNARDKIPNYYAQPPRKQPATAVKAAYRQPAPSTLGPPGLASTLATYGTRKKRDNLADAVEAGCA